MERRNKKSTTQKELPIVVALFIIVYSGVMLLKYLTNDNLTWLSTFLMMFSITTIYFILRSTKRKQK
ncbi:hypothetical protein [Virgibacillus halodenitrificans]|uniref:Group-specific protein n=1 Tax=Virgibacillus halodenitrificans TaxID=1482 RepID=A0ABR7VJS7_VIRHA|nr:hypothetical protein [Virgibacillus halodenitrificans]MBD1221933.1 hypothetical protein [Virgibacillus halodenitrificans]